MLVLDDIGGGGGGGGGGTGNHVVHLWENSEAVAGGQ